ncbi:MAG: glycosyltransferase [Candidatus Altiarchaeales archaeon]|nr:glycosyltransferase [Candidatus Altiarchaeales archaeon]
MTPIYMTSFFRKHFTERAVREIHERTEPGTFEIHIYDNGSDKETRDYLNGLLDQGLVKSVMLDSRNTGCRYNKGIFHMMTTVDEPYYIVSDNDVFPPKLTPDWLSQMRAIMDAHPEVALLTPQLPPQSFQMPDFTNIPSDIVYCKAVGNTYKMVRREKFPLDTFAPQLGQYSDDSYVSNYVSLNGDKVAFCRNIFCYHAGQCHNWGYTQEQIDKDPRKQGYGKPFVYEFEDEEKYLPVLEWRI